MRIAVIRIRGLVRIKKEIEDTLTMLRLKKKNSCVILENNPSSLGMVKKVRDYVTYGEIDDETYKLIMDKQKIIGSKEGSCCLRLKPPKGGFERKGIKVSFSAGGALGYRGDKINILIEKMV